MRRVVVLALLAVAVNAALVLPHAFASPEGAPLHLLFAGEDGPSAEVVDADFDEPLVAGVGHDGQQIYAIARNPWHPTEVADHLDQPVYRIGRPLLPLLGWALHPTGGGPGLVWALFAVNLVGVFLVGLGAGLLSIALRGPAWAAFVIPMLPCSFYSLDLTLADSLTLGLALLAIWALFTDRIAFAAVLAVLAVLAKEATIVFLVGAALWRRDLRAAAVVLPPLVVSGSLRLGLAAVLPPDQADAVNFDGPFQGIWTSRQAWFEGRQVMGGVWVFLALALGVAAFLRRRGLEHPLGWAVGIQFVFSILLDAVAILHPGNAARTMGPLMALGALMLVTPGVGAENGEPA